MQFLIRVILFTVLCINSRIIFAAEPLVTRFQPDIAVYPQFFAVTQDLDRTIYIGATDGILRYDGGQWRLYETPSPGPVRVLLTDSQGRVWFGGSNCFGYLKRLPDGEDQLIDLSGQFQNEFTAPFSDSWRVAEYHGVIYLRALYHLFALDMKSGKRVGFWHNPKRFGGPFVVHDQLYLQWRGEGLRRWDGSDFQPLAGTEALGKTVAGSMMPLGKTDALILDATPAMYLWRDDTLSQVEFDSEDQLAHLFNGIALSEEQFIFAGDDGQIRFFDYPSKSFTPFRIGNTFVPDLHQDRDGDILALDSLGLVKFAWPPRLSRFTAADNVASSIRKLALHQDQIISMTSSGVLAAPTLNDLVQSKFESLAWTGDEAWNLLHVDQDVLFADSRSLKLIRDNRVIGSIGEDDLYPRQLLQDQTNSNRIWIGTEHGPALVEREAGSYKLRGRMQDLGWLVNSMAQNQAGIWLGSDNLGLRLIQADDSAIGFKNQEFDFASHINYGKNRKALVSQIGRMIILSTENELYQLDGNSLRELQDEKIEQLRGEREVLRFIEGPDQTLWALSYFSVFRKAKNADWELMFSSTAHFGSMEDLLPLKDGSALVGGSIELLHIKSTSDLGIAAKPTVKISAANLMRGDQVIRPLDLTETPHFFMDGNLQVMFAFSKFENPATKQYQFKLSGYAEEWSSWSNRPDATFYALPAGAYELLVRARLSSGNTVESAPFRFVVEPRWYQRLWVRYVSLVAITAAIGAALIQRQRRRVKKLRAVNVELDQLVLQRTTELEQANQRLQNLADSDGLTGIANRRRFDQFLDSSLAHARAHHGDLGLAILDVDHFKQFNDSHGHQAGDELLIRLADILSHLVRGDTLAARYGGEEFAIIAPGCDVERMRELAERVRVQIESSGLSATVSIGVSAIGANDTTSRELLIAKADQALYRAKHQGRNRVEVG